MIKRGLFVFLFLAVSLIILVRGIGIDYAKPYHNSTNITIGIDGINKTINEITASNFAFPSHIYALGLKINPGHNINETWVSVKDGEMTLLKALSSTNKLCPANPIKTSYTYSPADKSQPYHYANEIQLSSGKTLQETINAGDFCYSWTNSSTCSVICGGGIRETYCVRNNSIRVADNYCYGTKPSVSCNTQGCVWVLIYRGCGPSGCGGCDPNSISGTPCSPAGSKRGCCVEGLCGAAGSGMFGFECK